MEESGQSGITVWEDRIFLTILKPFDSEEIKDAKNSSIQALCLDWQGKLVWERRWRSENDILIPKKDFPLNKQFEPFMVGDTLVHVEPCDREDGRRELGWHYLFGLDKRTGEEKWISEDALTQYNTPGYSGQTHERNQEVRSCLR